MIAALNRQHALALVQALVLGGAKHAVVSPGSRNTPLVLAMHSLAQQGLLKLHTVLDERAAAFFGLGLARASGGPVLISCTSGSAGAHYLPAIAEAHASGLPLIALTADRPAELQGCGAAQTMNQQRLFGDFVRWQADLSEPFAGDHRWLAGVAARALYAAAGPRPGPVHLNLPFREPLWDAEEGEAPPAPSYLPQVRWSAPALGELDLRALAAPLSAARRGVIVVGPRDLFASQREPGFDEALQRLSDTLGWPVLAEPASQLRYGPAQTLVVEALLRGPASSVYPDCVLRFGHTPTCKPLNQWLARSDAPVYAVDPCGDWHDPDHRVHGLFVSEGAALCRALVTWLQPSTEPGWGERWARLAGRAEQALAQACEASPLWEGAIARAVVQALPAGSLLHVASSMPIRDLDAFTPDSPRPIALAFNRGVNGIDGTLATALGEAQLHPGPSLVLMGDLAFLHDLGALNLAAQLPRHPVVVVIDNGGGNIFAFLPIGAHPSAFEAHFLTPQALSVDGFAQAAGAWLRRVETLPALREALQEALQGTGLRVIVVSVDREHNLSAHRKAWAQVAQAIASAESP